ncbi:MAG: hypothetical protein JNM85_09745 [Chthonomonas sp.]|nr:hypothetical protein [Chthonomonas sp.]
MASSSAFSIGSYSFQRLPDLGFGGQALGIGDGPLGGVMDFNDMVVGYVNNGIGGSTATAWKRSGGVWGGLKGALSLALAIGLPEGIPFREQVVAVTFGVVALFVIVQGMTMPLLMRKLGLVG